MDINISSFISPDNGITWYPGSPSPGPNVPSDTNPYFKFIVTNTGNVNLTNVQVMDSVYGLIGTAANLKPGISIEYIYVGIWAPGAQNNITTASGDAGGQTISDTSFANWVGIEISIPAIKVQKLVSSNGGITWLTTNSPTGPLVLEGTNVTFYYLVTNTGNVPLTNVEINDNAYGLVLGPMNLNAGATASVITTQPWLLGQQTNITTATGDFEGATVSAQDTAYWFGVEEATPAIYVSKEVSPDNGITWYDANTAPGPNVPEEISPRFRFRVINIGNVILTNVVVDDNIYGLIFEDISLEVGQTLTTIITTPWLQGQQVNTATATCDEGVTDQDSAYWFGLEAPTPEITVLKEVSPDNGVTWLDADTPPGPDIPYDILPRFKFTVTNNGPVPLNNVLVTDDIYGEIGTVTTLAPGVFAILITVEAWVQGGHTNSAIAEGYYNGVIATATNSANYVGVSPPASISIEKFVSVDEGATWLEANTPPGPLLPPGVTPQFMFTVNNTGEVTLTNITVTDNVLGPICSLASLDPGDSYDFFI